MDIEMEDGDMPQSSSNQEIYTYSSGISSRSESSSSDAEIEDYFKMYQHCLQEPCSSSSPTNTFRVLSFNVLSQKLLESHRHLYRGCNKENLKWENRFLRIINIIINSKADIICLQEIEQEHFPYFELKFAGLGFRALYKKKIMKTDGCAILYRVTKFKLLDKLTVEFKRPQAPVLDRDNVAILAKLVFHDYPDKTPIIVVNTHLLYNPRRTDVRLAQIRLLLAEIDGFAYYDTGNTCGHFPIILTGDFNSKPSSPVVQLIRKGFLRDPIVDGHSSLWRNIGVTNNCQYMSAFCCRVPGIQGASTHNPEQETAGVVINEIETEFFELFNGITLTHPYKFLSVYDHVKTSGEKEVTTYQNGWVTVDYIFYSKCKELRLDFRQCLPSASSITHKLPNEICASDHLPLAATFSYLL